MLHRELNPYNQPEIDNYPFQDSGREKLKKLANFLKNVSQDRFNLSLWATHEFAEDNCYSQACAIGWASILFPNSGLMIIKNQPHFRHYTQWEAVSKFFEISINDACKLFSPTPYIQQGNSISDPVLVSDKIGEYLSE